MKIDISTLHKLENFSKDLAPLLPKNTIITLEGDLGAGKTTFSQYLLKALGVKSHIPSPTFTIINEYKTKELTILHADFYRLDNEDNLDLLGWDILIQNADIVLVEWPKGLVNPTIEIKISSDENRVLTLKASKEITSKLQHYSTSS